MYGQVDLDALRNGAVVAWLQPSADDERLCRFLEEVDPAKRIAVEESARAVRAALRDFWYGGFPGDQDECLAEHALRAHLTSRFPWLSERGFQALFEHVDWLE